MGAKSVSSSVHVAPSVEISFCYCHFRDDLKPILQNFTAFKSKLYFCRNILEILNIYIQLYFFCLKCIKI